MTTQQPFDISSTRFPVAVQPLAAGFRKDPAEESFLDDLNLRLATFHDAEVTEQPEHFPTLHVVGPPRSGTTLLMQLLAAHLEVGYINNLIASFWRVPLYGIRLSKKVNRRNFGSAFNLCHWLALEGEKNLTNRLNEITPYLLSVSICGADGGLEAKGASWKRLIQPLGKGSFDNLAFLREVVSRGWGPNVFHMYS